LTVLAVGGDGDGLSIGIGHFPHAARRNVNITYLLLDNRIYGLTKGQTSPTTRQGFRTKTSPHGVVETPMNPVELAIIFGATFTARGYSGHPKLLHKLITQAISHEGFSLVHVLSPCLTFAKGSGFEYFNSIVKPLPDDHDPADRQAALVASNDAETIYSGVFYQSESDEYFSRMQQDGSSRGRELDDSHPRIDIEALIDRFS
ncbi:MAG: 2-oxoacid:ferredoxin oxidoreductase subunit beta, partial [Candidatus Eisenbacteria sp.]|nr:2-oxoacid:ferredoxin oxidoreductase subunit beta [Candidatus Eisenbacteria bacterium]